MNSEIITRRNTKHNWQEIDNYFLSGHSLKECREKFKFNHSTLAYARKVGKSKIPDIISTTRKKDLTNILVYGQKLNNTWLKKRLIKDKLLAYVCSECEINKWNGKILVLQLDHIDGDRKNNVLSNLRLICPNCHSQTPTFCRGMKFRV